MEEDLEMKIPDSYAFFSQPKIISGSCALENIPLELDALNARKPLIIMASGGAKTGPGKKIVTAFKGSGVVIGAICDNISPDASLDMVYGIAQLFRDRGCDSIIAAGSGSVVDAAKVANIVISTNTSDIAQYAGENAVLENNLKPLVAVPTGLSTGYEATDRARIGTYNFRSDYISPDVIVIDSRMIKFGDADAPALSAMPALTHAIEAFLSEKRNPMSDVYASTAMQLLHENLAAAIKRLRNKKACLAVANAAAMAGISFSNVQPGIIDTLAQAVADVTDFPIGVCMGILLPYGMLYLRDQKVGIRSDLLMALSGPDVFAETPDGQRTEKSIATIQQLVAAARGVVPGSFKELNIPNYKLKEIVRVASERSRAYSVHDYTLLLDKAWAGIQE